MIVRVIFILTLSALLLTCKTEVKEPIGEQVSEVIEKNDKVESKPSAVVSTEEVVKSEEEIKEKLEQETQSAKTVEEEVRQASKLKDMPCDKILEKYKQAIDLFRKDLKSKEARRIYREMMNDPNFNDCKAKKAYADTFEKLEKEFFELRKKR